MFSTVLIVEDYEDTRELMSLLLEREGYRVLEAENGQQAVEITKKELPDLILMDLSLPIMDGITATREIKSNNQTRNIPIISVTAHDESHRNQAIDAGCCAAIGKPVEFENLKEVIHKILKG